MARPGSLRTRVLAVCPPGLPALRALQPLAPQIELQVGCDLATVARHAPVAEVILYSALAGDTPAFAEVWRHTGAALRWVHSFETGVDRMLTPELIASPVQVSNARGVYAAPLAEFAVLGMLFFYKRMRRLLAQQQAARWEQFEVEALAGKVMGIVGYGAIGRACGRAARNLGMRLLPARRGLAPAELQALLAQCDVVLAAAPLTPATRHLLGEAEFAAMKPAALVINVGRGPVIDESALISALAAGRIAGAALDVFEREPLAPAHPYWTMDNVLLSPHCTDRTLAPHWAEMGMRCFVQNFRCYRRGKPLRTLVDKTAGY